MLVRDVHQSKAQFPIVVTEFGMVTLDNKVQLPKATSPIVVTELGMVMLVNEIQL